MTKEFDLLFSGFLLGSFITFWCWYWFFTAFKKTVQKRLRKFINKK